MELIETEKLSRKELLLNKAGATREAGARVIAEAMVATKTTVDKYGDEHVEADHNMRLRAEELRAKYTGDLKEVTVDARTVNISIGGSPSEVAALLDMVKHVKSELISLKTSGKQTGEIIDIRANSGTTQKQAISV